MDVSMAVDRLFAGVVPEREGDLRRWAVQAERVRLLDRPEFLLQVAFGTIQVSESALRQIWLTGYAGLAATEAYDAPLRVGRALGWAFDPAAWNADPEQAAWDARFDLRIDAVRELASGTPLDGLSWPPDVPEPVEGRPIEDPAMKATFDLVCMAGAFVFAHELRHALLRGEEECGLAPIEEERECDAWALDLMLGRVADYCSRTGEEETAVRAKRTLGVVIAQLAITTVTPRGHWKGSETHPPVRERLGAGLDAVGDAPPEWFWRSVAAMLTAFARKLDALPPPMAFPSTDRELALLLCGRFA